MQIISFEGIDGCGKSTAMELLKRALEDSGKKVATVKFPRYNSPIGELIKNCLEGKYNLDKRVFHALYDLDRLDYNSYIATLEKEGYDFLLCDRHYLSNVVFAMSKQFSDSEMEWLMNLGENDRKPDKSYILDVPVSVSFERRPERRDKHETDVQLLNSVRDNYLELASSDSSQLKVINGENPTEAIVAQILFDIFSEV